MKKKEGVLEINEGFKKIVLKKMKKWSGLPRGSAEKPRASKRNKKS